MHNVPAVEISQPPPHKKALGIINRLSPLKLFVSLPSIIPENRPAGVIVPALEISPPD